MKRQELTFLPQFFDRYINLVDANTEIIDGLEMNEVNFKNTVPKLIENQNYSHAEGNGL